MKNLLRWAAVLMMVLAASSSWAVPGDSLEGAAEQPMYMATINGVVFELSSARDVARAALEQGISIADMVNGLGFAGAALDEIVGGALDFGATPEAMALVLMSSGYSPPQILQAVQASHAPTGVMEQFAALIGTEPGGVMASAAPGGGGSMEEDCAREVRPEFDRAMDEAAAQGRTAEAVVRRLLERGFDLCGVVKSAIERGENLDDIFAGARAAGYSREMVAREAVAAGSAEGEILLALRNSQLLGLGYTPGTERAAGFSSMTPIQGSVGGNVRGRIVSSPYTF